MPSDMSSPEHVAKVLQELRMLNRELEECSSDLETRYKSLYMAAKNGATPGGSLGQIRSKGTSDPTQAAVLSPGEIRFRRGCRFMQQKIRDAMSDLNKAHGRYEELLETLEGSVIDGHFNSPLTHR
jgi:hypothetical protein